MKKVMYFPLVVLLSLVVGCAGKQGTGGSWVGELPTDNAVQGIASDATQQLEALYAPGHTSLYLLTPKENKNAFSQLFEDNLRKKGFTISPLEQSQSVKLAYVLDKIKPEEKEEPAYWYLQLKIWDTHGVIHSYARSYAASGSIEAGRTLTTVSNQKSLGERIKEKAKKTYEKEENFTFFDFKRGRSKR